MKSIPIPVAAVAFVLFSCTVYPGVGGSLDSAEFQISGKVLGITHPTGYPVYQLLTHLLSYVPFGTLAVRVSLFSSLCMAVAAGLLYACAYRVSGSMLFSILASLVLTLSSAVWSLATIAEVYAFQTLVTCTALYFLLKVPRNPRFVYPLALVLGIGFAHHLMTLFLFTGIILTLCFSDQRSKLDGKTILTSFFCLILPLLSFLYFPIRQSQGAHSFDLYAFDSLQDYVRYFLGGNNTGLLRLEPFWVLNEGIQKGVAFFLQHFGLLPAVFALVGFYELWKNNRQGWFILFWLGSVHLFLTGIWTDADREAVLVPALLSASVCFAVGGNAVADALRNFKITAAYSSTLTGLAVFLFLLLQGDSSFQSIATRNGAAMDMTHEEIYKTLPPKAVILTSAWEPLNLFKYMIWSGENPPKQMTVYRWNDPRSRAGLDKIAAYLQGSAPFGTDSLPPDDKRRIFFLEPPDADQIPQSLSLVPLEVRQERFITEVVLASDAERSEKGYTPLVTLPFETLEWSWTQPVENRTINGNPLMIAGNVYREGYGVHGGTRIQIPVPPGATRFSAVIGASDDLPTDAATSIIVLLSSGETLLKRSPTLLRNSQPYELDYAIDGEKTLTLEIWGTDDGLKADHAVLANPRFYFD